LWFGTLQGQFGETARVRQGFGAASRESMRNLFSFFHEGTLAENTYAEKLTIMFSV
jgi:hypothetical protein